MNRFFYVPLIIGSLALSGCGDHYSLDKDRGPDPKGIQTQNYLVLPPDYTLRAPEPMTEPVAPSDASETPAINKTQVKEETPTAEEATN